MLFWRLFFSSFLIIVGANIVGKIVMAFADQRKKRNSEAAPADREEF
jgi:hypothetical protein